MASECKGHEQEGNASPHSEVLNDNKIAPMVNTPLRYLSLCHLYSATSPHVGVSRSSNIMSKKVNAKKTSSIDHLGISNETMSQPESSPRKPIFFRVYSRRKKIHRQSFSVSLTSHSELEKPVLAALEPSVEINCHNSDIGCGDDSGSGLADVKARPPRKRTVRSSELALLSAESGAFATLDGPRVRANRNHVGDVFKAKRPRLFDSNCQSDNNRRWIEFCFDRVDSKRLIGLKCKVYWPLDDKWYCGRILAYDIKTKKHKVAYDDGDKENLILKDEKIKFFVSGLEIQKLNLKIVSDCTEDIMVDCNEMAALAAILDNCEEIDRGDVIWAKITGYAMWPAIVLDEPIVSDDEDCKSTRGGCISVQFFGTHDFARVNLKQAVSFLKGLISSFHLKCKKPYFLQGLKEVKRYLSERKLPEKMFLLQTGTNVDDHANTTGDDAAEIDSCGSEQKDHSIPGEFQGRRFAPFQIGDIEIISLGNCVKNPQHFRDGAFIWPEGYTATRMFLSVEDPNKTSIYRMEVLKESDSGAPLFRVTSDSGQQFEGLSPSSCWNKIYRAIRRMGDSYIAGPEGVEEHLHMSGLDMFGLSNREILVLIQDSSNAEAKSILSDRKVVPEKVQDLSTGYSPVHLELNDLDKCNVCHMDEEYLNNLFLQCDRCRIMVHSRCYGESEPADGLWLCNLCRSGASPSPICCLCPVIGGAMKPTTDGRWAHLTCAIWIPETCFYDVKKMEPIDGISGISKDRWKLLCSLCGVAYGACIQCSNNTCYVAYHPLCARAAGLCVETIDEDRLHLVSSDDEIDNLDECISLLSFCKKHKQPTIKPPASDIEFRATALHCSKYKPPCNPSGCARSEPYSYFGRRGRKEPEAFAAASMKRAFVENQPYLVGGNFHDMLYGRIQVPTIVSPKSERLNVVELDACKNILSTVEKYIEMKNTFRKRLAFGKSGIHGFGIFAKMPHRAGDMVIEYAGELVRPSVADRRERLIYNLLVGAGTYMFRIDDERVIDATRAGTIAHLINHSCEPNCYSRAVTFNGDDHIIIFAKRDIEQWEELTYDYRFYSTDEHLPCYCGFPRCRGVVNDIEAERLLAKFYVPRTALKYGYP